MLFKRCVIILYLMPFNIYVYVIVFHCTKSIILRDETSIKHLIALFLIDPEFEGCLSN